MHRISNDIVKIIAPFKNHRGFIYGQLFLDWSKIVGEELAKITAPLKMALYKNKPGALTIQTTSAASLYLHALEEEIIEKINQFAKITLVDKLKYKHVLSIKTLPLEESIIIPIEELQGIQEITASIKDDILQGSLQKLGVGILQKKIRERPKNAR